MFASYVSEASPGCRYVLGACERCRLRGRDRRDERGRRDGRDGRERRGRRGRDDKRERQARVARAARQARQHRSTRLIAHTEYYYTLCAITATAIRSIFSPDLFCRLDFHFGLLARLIPEKNL